MKHVENMMNIMQYVEKIKEYKTINTCFYLCLCVILVSAYFLVSWVIWFHISASNKALKKWWGSSMSNIFLQGKVWHLAQGLNEISIPIPFQNLFHILYFTHSLKLLFTHNFYYHFGHFLLSTDSLPDESVFKNSMSDYLTLLLFIKWITCCAEFCTSYW